MGLRADDSSAGVYQPNARQLLRRASNICPVSSRQPDILDPQP